MTSSIFAGGFSYTCTLLRLSAGRDAICKTEELQIAVIPAKAGIYSADLRNCGGDGLDSRFRGNDRRSEGDPIPNDTKTPIAGRVLYGTR
jgi:hypothetical protein